MFRTPLTLSEKVLTWYKRKIISLKKCKKAIRIYMRDECMQVGAAGWMVFANVRTVKMFDKSTVAGHFSLMNIRNRPISSVM